MKRRKGTASFLTVCLALLLLAGCKKDGQEDVAQAPSYDPNKEVVVTDFTPRSGGVGQRLIVYGSNFGNDPDIVKVKIGGKKAILINVKGSALYCLVPEKAYSGEVEVTIGSDSQQKQGVAPNKFEYQRKMIVTTLAGTRDERGNFETKDGPFNNCGGFFNPSYFTWDPKDPDLLYIAQDGGDVRLLNFRDSTVTTPITRGMGNWSRIRSIEFTKDMDHMVIANDQGDINGISTSILTRGNRFRDPQLLTSYRQCNGAAIHPVNGEMYFNSFEKGQLFRFDMEKYFAGETDGVKDYEELFKIQDNDWEFVTYIHPTGSYAYIVVINRHYILRTDYNWERKAFMQPYVVCGEPGASGWNDGVGTNVRLNQPYQGVFVKNPEYTGRQDEYDFYFTEVYNHDIRILSPEGKVTTFAGRGSSSINPNPYGYIDGDLRQEARFDRPRGIAYDEVNKVFYIGDTENRRIRKIGWEE